ncbi:lactonase family protein [Glycomyces buryatensis]|nr:beta-propeller fold lactonase family protein [Glycomyces buryatensis]
MRYLLGDYTTEGGPGLVVAGPDGLGTPAAVVNPSWVSVTDSAVYSLTETEPGYAASWRLGPDFTLDRNGASRPTGGDNPCHAAVDPSGRWFLAANYGSAGGGSVAVFPIEADGSLGESTVVHKLVGSGPDAERQAGPHAHQVVCHGGFVLVVDLGSDRIWSFRLTEAGLLDPVASTELEPGFGPRHLAFIDDRAVLAGELANAVAVGTFDAGLGTFSFGPSIPLPDTDTADLAALPDIGLPEDAPRPYPAAVVPDPRLGLVYVTIRGTDQVAVIDPAAPALIRSVPVGASWPRDAVLGDDGTLLVACQHGGVVMRVDPNGAEAPVRVWECGGVSSVAPLT